MKTLFLKLTTVIIMSVQLLCCAEKFPSGYTPELPELPESWVSLLGEPHWRLEWINSNGHKEIRDISPGGSKRGTEMNIPVTWTNPVTAWPYWPEFNLIPGLFKPAGALFPFDVSGDSLLLSWKAGPDTVFYWELAYANENNYSRIPANFDWPRFRQLFKTGTVREDVREDPWLVDWRSLAERTVSSTFSQSRLVPQPSTATVFPVPAGTWYGASPFAKPLFVNENESSSFPVRQGINVWISAKGILRCNGNVWIFIEWQ